MKLIQLRRSGFQLEKWYLVAKRVDYIQKRIMESERSGGGEALFYS